MTAKHKIKFVLAIFSAFLLASCIDRIGTDRQTTNLARLSLSLEIKHYIHQNLASRSSNGKVYCAYEVLDTDRSIVDEKVYLWVVCQEYYCQGKKLETGTGGSFPAVLTILQENEKLVVLNHQKPRDGGYYRADLESIFSKKALALTNSASSTIATRLLKQIKQQAGVI